jgi:hypothetical protein
LKCVGPSGVLCRLLPLPLLNSSLPSGVKCTPPPPLPLDDDEYDLLAGWLLFSDRVGAADDVEWPDDACK